jgi:hypothetical protein
LNYWPVARANVRKGVDGAKHSNAIGPSTIGINCSNGESVASLVRVFIRHQIDNKFKIACLMNSRLPAVILSCAS